MEKDTKIKDGITELYKYIDELKEALTDINIINLNDKLEQIGVIHSNLENWIDDLDYELNFYINEINEEIEELKEKKEQNND